MWTYLFIYQHKMYMYRLKHRLMLYLIYYPSVYYLWCFGDFEKKINENLKQTICFCCLYYIYIVYCSMPTSACLKGFVKIVCWITKFISIHVILLHCNTRARAHTHTCAWCQMRTCLQTTLNTHTHGKHCAGKWLVTHWHNTMVYWDK